jgi:hypothetical protein
MMKLSTIESLLLMMENQRKLNLAHAAHWPKTIIQPSQLQIQKIGCASRARINFHYIANSLFSFKKIPP